MLTLYEILGVQQDSGLEEIRRCFRKKVSQLHPDQGGQEQDRDEYQKITEAYKVLSDAETRALYDRSIRPFESVQDLFLRHCAQEQKLQLWFSQAPAAPQRGEDVAVVVEISDETQQGIIEVSTPWAEKTTQLVTLPRQRKDLPFCLCANLGKPGKNGGKAGDLILILKQKQLVR